MRLHTFIEHVYSYHFSLLDPHASFSLSPASSASACFCVYDEDYTRMNVEMLGKRLTLARVKSDFWQLRRWIAKWIHGSSVVLEQVPPGRRYCLVSTANRWAMQRRVFAH